MRWQIFGANAVSSRFVVNLVDLLYQMFNFLRYSIENSNAHNFGNAIINIDILYQWLQADDLHYDNQNLIA